MFTSYLPDGSIQCITACPPFSNKGTAADGTMYCKQIVCQPPMIISSRQVGTMFEFYCMNPECPSDSELKKQPDGTSKCMPLTCPVGSVIITTATGITTCSTAGCPINTNQIIKNGTMYCETVMCTGNMIIQKNSAGIYVCGYTQCVNGLVPQTDAATNGFKCVCPIGNTPVTDLTGAITACNINKCPATETTIYNPDGSIGCSSLGCPQNSNVYTNPDGTKYCKVIVCTGPTVLSKTATGDLYCMNNVCPNG